MMPQPARAVFRFASLSLVILSILAAVPAQARSDANRSFTLAGRQWLLIERMTNSALLAALGVDVSPHLGSVYWSRNRFDRTLNELRNGDPHLGLSPATRPEIVDTLDRVDSRWRRYDAVFSEITAGSTISARQIQSLTQIHEETTAALAQMVDAYEFFVNGGRHHTMLSSTIEGLGDLRAQTQLVLRALLTIAYEGDSSGRRAMLVRATDDFDRTLAGLINGDPANRLLRPPAPEILDELLRVEAMWRLAHPILDSVASGGLVTQDEIATVAGYANEMALPLTMALLMYLSL